MGIRSGKREYGAVGAKGLVLKGSAAFAIYREGEFGTEAREVDVGGSATYLFVGGEQNLDGAVRHLGVRNEPFYGGHDFGDSGFVVGAE
jgi:hypothetical protein